MIQSEPNEILTTTQTGEDVLSPGIVSRILACQARFTKIHVALHAHLPFFRLERVIAVQALCFVTLGTFSNRVGNSPKASATDLFLIRLERVLATEEFGPLTFGTSSRGRGE